MKRIVTCVAIFCFCLSLVGCKNNTSTQSNIHQKTFDEAQAISMVVKNHPDFPSNPSDIKMEKLSTGGPQGTTTDVKFTTTVEKEGEAAYIVTLTKDWGITVNGKDVKSSWKYSVNLDEVTTLESVDQDNLPNEIK